MTRGLVALCAGLGLLLITVAEATEVQWEWVFDSGPYACDGILHTRVSSFPGARHVHRWIVFMGAAKDSAGDLYVGIRTDSRTLAQIGADRYANPSGPVFYPIEYGAGNWVSVADGERLIIDYFAGAAATPGVTPLCHFAVLAVTS